MANNDEKWYFSKEQLENSPSRKCGIDAYKELQYRQQAANFIQDLGQRLKVTQLCINTGIVYMHRFYVFHSFTHFPWQSIASAALFLAAKVEEQPRKLEHVIKFAQLCKTHNSHQSVDINSERYQALSQDLVFNENILLQTLGFDVAIDHPHTHVVKCCHLVRASKDLAQTSYFLASNSLHLTTMCLQYRPTVVACFCILLACKWSNWEIPLSNEQKEWFSYIDPTVTSELLQQLCLDFLEIYDKCPSRLKEKVMIMQTQDNEKKNQTSSDKDGHSHRSHHDKLGHMDDPHNKHRSSRPHDPSSSSSSSSQQQKEREYREKKERERMAQHGRQSLPSQGSKPPLMQSGHGGHHNRPSSSSSLDPKLAGKQPHARPSLPPSLSSSSSNQQQQNAGSSNHRDSTRDILRESSSSISKDMRDYRYTNGYAPPPLPSNASNQSTSNEEDVVNVNVNVNRKDRGERMHSRQSLPANLSSSNKNMLTSSSRHHQQSSQEQQQQQSIKGGHLRPPSSQSQNTSSSSRIPDPTREILRESSSGSSLSNSNSSSKEMRDYRYSSGYVPQSQSLNQTQAQQVQVSEHVVGGSKVVTNLLGDVVKEELPSPYQSQQLQQQQQQQYQMPVVMKKQPSLFSPEKSPPNKKIPSPALPSLSQSQSQSHVLSGSNNGPLNINVSIKKDMNIPELIHQQHTQQQQQNLVVAGGGGNSLFDPLPVAELKQAKVEPTFVNETNPTLISNLLKEAPPVAVASLTPVVPAVEEKQPLAAVSTATAMPVAAAVVPEEPVVVVPPPHSKEKEKEHHHKSKKKNKEKHKHKDKDRNREEKKKKHKDKDKEREGKHHKSSKGDKGEKEEAPIILTIPKDKILQPSEHQAHPVAGLKLKIPKERLVVEPTAPSISGGGLKIKIPKDVLIKNSSESGGSSSSSRKRDRGEQKSSPDAPPNKKSGGSYSSGKQNGRSSSSYNSKVSHLGDGDASSMHRLAESKYSSKGASSS